MSWSATLRPRPTRLTAKTLPRAAGRDARLEGLFDVPDFTAHDVVLDAGWDTPPANAETRVPLIAAALDSQRLEWCVTSRDAHSGATEQRVYEQGELLHAYLEDRLTQVVLVVVTRDQERPTIALSLPAQTPRARRQARARLASMCDGLRPLMSLHGAATRTGATASA